MPENRKLLREQADECRASIEAAKLEKAAAFTPAERKELTEHIHLLERVEGWLRASAD